MQKDRVQNHHVRPVLLGNAVVVRGIGDPAQPVAETKTVGLHLVEVPCAGGERDIADRVRRFRRKAHDLARKAPEVSEHHRVVIQRVGRAEDNASVGEAAVGHALDHHVEVARMVQVPVADHDRVQRREVDASLGVLHDRSRTRVEAHASVAFFDVETT